MTSTLDRQHAAYQTRMDEQLANFRPLMKDGAMRWTSCGTAGYCVVGEGTTSKVLVDSEEIVRVERPFDEKNGKGWDVVILNEVVGHHRLKADAQGEAESYLR